VALASLLIVASAQAAAAWTVETSATTANLYGLTCFNFDECLGVGALNSSNENYVYSSNGTTWGITGASSQQLNSITCADATHCWMVGNAGTIDFTNNASITPQTSHATVNLQGVVCPNTLDCFAVGAKSGSNGVIDATTNGGTTWATQTSTGGQQLNAVDCPDTTHCSAVGNAGLVLATTDGTSWAAQTSNTTQALTAVKLVNDGFGWADGAGGTIDAYGCRAGGLNLTAPGSLAWPSTALAGTNQTVTTTAAVTIDDETAGFAGWSLSLTSTTLTNAGSKTLPTTAATLTGVSAAAGTGDCTMPTNAIAYPVAVPAAASPPAAVKVFDSALATGGGPVNLTLGLSLAIPSKSVAGTYSSTWTFTLASGP
jgi:hypothetical protein